MKETHYFFTPDINVSDELPEEEVRHASKVLRLRAGDNIVLTDGKGTLYNAKVTEISSHSCRYEICNAEKQQPLWRGKIHIALAPTKNMDRTEWFVEKAAEIGFDELSLVYCHNSERRSVKLDRIERILVAAVKQSHKAFMPKVNEPATFGDFIKHKDLSSARYIAHCLDDTAIREIPGQLGAQFLKGKRCYLPSIMSEDRMTVLVGPEGDFTCSEVEAAITSGFLPVSLGRSRLRTETAALFAVMLMNLHNSNSYDRSVLTDSRNNSPDTDKLLH